MSTPIDLLFAGAKMYCAKCGNPPGCACWEPCHCGWTKEVDYPCNNPTCDRNVPTLTAAQWVLLLDVEATGDAGHRLDERCPNACALRDHRLITQPRSGRIVCTVRGRECVAAVIRLDEETKAKEQRDKRNKARRDRRAKAGDDACAKDST